jgi:3-phosphoshikimate 1-carboxyvinyltransferase
MHERPIRDLVDGLTTIGAQIDYLGQQGYPPLQIKPGQILTNKPVQVRGDVSSQFLTALLMALPLTQHSNPIEVQVKGELISKPYIEITLRLMEKFGIKVENEGWQRFIIPAHEKKQAPVYVSPGEFWVEGDASSASYFLAAGALGGGPLKIHGVGRESIQGDVAFAQALSMMGANISQGQNWIEVRGIDTEDFRLKAIELDCTAIPDAAMTLAVLALFADGPSTLTGIASWKVKETDRIAAMTTELKKLGAQVIAGDDYIKVTPPATWLHPKGGIDTYDDHRMAMCFSLAAFGPLPIQINHPECVTKTYPNYFDDFLGIVS